MVAVELSQRPLRSKALADIFVPLGYVPGMSSEPLELNDEAQTEYYARWEAVETVKAQELAAMTEERAWQIIRSLRPFTEPWRDPSNGMGLVEQQAIFHRRKSS